MLNISKNDHLVCEFTPQGKKTTRKILVRVSEITKDKVYGVMFKDTAQIPYEGPLKDIFANLGAKPRPGWVYGVNISELVTIEEMADGSSLILKADLSDEHRAMLEAALLKWDHILSKLNFDLEIRPAHKKILGTYQTRKQKSRTDVMCLYLGSFKTERQLDHTITHEAGHGLWNRFVTPKSQARMIEHYLESITLNPAELPVIEVMGEKFDAFDGTIAQYMKMMTPADKKIFKKVLIWIKAIYKIKREELDNLHSGGISTLKYFPNHKIVESDVTPIITQYATTNVYEFFCESFSLYHLGDEIPADVWETIKKINNELFGE